jgi:protein-tyrosine phosphatase
MADAAAGGRDSHSGYTPSTFPLAAQGVDMTRFAPAAPEEETVFGASAPGFGAPLPGEDGVDDWLDAMREEGVDRVCCLLSDEQVDRYDGLLGRYREALGDEAVLHAPVPDHHLAAEATLTGEVLPFFRAADDDGERVVAHCLAGVGRTGHVLAAWLVHARGYDPAEALEAVRDTGRRPRDAVVSGNATDEELLALLSAVVD